MNKFESDISNQLSKFESDLFETILKVFEEDPTDKYRFCLVAAGVRELIRLIFERISPDEEVENCSWYMRYDYVKDKITRKQRMAYAICGGLDIIGLKTELNVDIDVVIKPLRMQVDELSKWTHVNEKTLISSTSTIDLYEKIVTTLHEFLAVKSKIKKEFAELISTQLIEDKVQQYVASNTIDSIDSLATHYYDPIAYIDELKILSIDSNTITVKATGNVVVTHQSGSDVDVKNNIGGTWDKSYPLSTILYLYITDDLHSFEIYDQPLVDVNTQALFIIFE